MVERGYINDSRLAERYTETFYEFKNMGLNKIRNELYRRGISKEDIDKNIIFKGLKSNTSYSINVDTVWINNAAYSNVYTINSEYLKMSSKKQKYLTN